MGPRAAGAELLVLPENSVTLGTKSQTALCQASRFPLPTVRLLSYLPPQRQTPGNKVLPLERKASQHIHHSTWSWYASLEGQGKGRGLYLFLLLTRPSKFFILPQPPKEI